MVRFTIKVLINWHLCRSLSAECTWIFTWRKIHLKKRGNRIRSSLWKNFRSYFTNFTREFSACRDILPAWFCERQNLLKTPRAWQKFRTNSVVVWGASYKATSSLKLKAGTIIKIHSSLFQITFHPTLKVGSELSWKVDISNWNYQNRPFICFRHDAKITTPTFFLVDNWSAGRNISWLGWLKIAAILLSIHYHWGEGMRFV